MNKFLICISILIIFSCRDTGKDLVGTWKVHSQFYQSTCQIYQEGRAVKGQILSYHDGTSTYKYDGTDKRFLFENLRSKDSVYVDGMSGATVKSETPQMLSIRQKSKDSLLVTTYIMNRPLTELWTKIVSKTITK